MRQNFDFDGPLTLTLHDTPLAQAQAAYDAHMAKRVEYDPRQACNSPHNEAARAWARKKHTLEEIIAGAHAKATPPVAFRPCPPLQQPKAKRGQGRRLTAQGLLATVHKSIDRMNALEPGCEEWRRAQNAAYHNRAQAVKRAREDGETIILPEIPKLRAS